MQNIMSLNIELHRNDLIQVDETLNDQEYAERLSEKIADTIAHYAKRGWHLHEARELEDGVLLCFEHTLPGLW